MKTESGLRLLRCGSALRLIGRRPSPQRRYLMFPRKSTAAEGSDLPQPVGRLRKPSPADRKHFNMHIFCKLRDLEVVTLKARRVLHDGIVPPLCLRSFVNIVSSAVRRGRRVQRGSNRVDEPLFADLSSQVNDCPGMKRGK